MSVKSAFPKEEVKIDLEKAIAHLVLVIPEFLERAIDALEAMADCAEFEAEYTKRIAMRDGVFTADELEGNVEKDSIKAPTVREG